MDIPLCISYFSCQCLAKKNNSKCLVEHNNCFKKNKKFVLLHKKNVFQIQISSLRKENGKWKRIGNVLVEQAEKSRFECLSQMNKIE